MTQESNRHAEQKDGLALFFCGDTFLKTRDETDPFALIIDQLKGGATCINCETSLEAGRRPLKNVALSVSEKSLENIPENISIISIVNNHMADGGDPADMVRVLRNHGKVVIGPENPARATADIDGLEIDLFSAYFSLPRARLSYEGRLADCLEAMLKDSTASCRVVNLHWGYEHTTVPAPFQRDLARRMVDAGAGLVIGHHPHVAQGWETYRGVKIFYSLGNFNFWQFDRNPSEDNKWGFMVRYCPMSGKTEVLPYRINDNYQPVLATGKDKSSLSIKLEELCREIDIIDYSMWLSEQYAPWRAGEYKVWINRCIKAKSPALVLKFIVWLLLPMQIRYYSHVVKKKISLLPRREKAVDRGD